MKLQRMPRTWKRKIQRGHCPRCPGDLKRLGADASWVTSQCARCSAGFMLPVKPTTAEEEQAVAELVAALPEAEEVH